MKKLILALLIVGALATSAFASAATLNVGGGSIQAGVDSTLYCDTNGVQVLGWGLETDSGLVNSVRIGGVDSACAGNTLFVRVENASGGLIGAGSVGIANSEPANGYKISFPGVAAGSIEMIKVWIEGGS